MILSSDIDLDPFVKATNLYIVIKEDKGVVEEEGGGGDDEVGHIGSEWQSLVLYKMILLLLMVTAAFGGWIYPAEETVNSIGIPICQKVNGSVPIYLEEAVGPPYLDFDVNTALFYYMYTRVFLGTKVQVLVLLNATTCPSADIVDNCAVVRTFSPLCADRLYWMYGVGGFSVCDTFSGWLGTYMTSKYGTNMFFYEYDPGFCDGALSSSSLSLDSSMYIPQSLASKLSIVGRCV